MDDGRRLTLTACGTILLANRMIGGETPFLTRAILDEAAHVATATLALQRLGARDPAFVGAALLSGVLIDLDHLPDTIFGCRILTGHSPRPYPHSLAMLAVVLAAGLTVPPARRRAVRGAAFGLASHLLRDTTDGSDGVPLFWPVRSCGVSFSRRLQAGFILAALVKPAGRSAD
jgi:hypothetical protein